MDYICNLQFTNRDVYTYRMMALSMYFLVSLFLVKLLLVQRCNGAVVYVTPTPPPKKDCPYGVPCHTLQHYFSNKSFTKQRDNLTLSLVFMSGEHKGFCEKTAIKSTALNVTGIGGRITIGYTNIELTNAAAIYFENVTLDHWYISSLRHMYIEHARNVSGNFIAFTFKDNSSLSGIL